MDERSPDTMRTGIAGRLDADALPEDAALAGEEPAMRPADASLSPRDAILAERMRRGDPVEARSLRGRPVVDLAQGRQVGTVTDLVLDTVGEKVVGLDLSLPGVFTGHSFLPFYRIRAIGEDAVTMDHGEWLEPPLSREATRGTVALRDLSGKRVMTDGGDAVGVLDEAVIDRTDGRIIAYLLASHGSQPARYLLWTRGLAVGEDMMVIPDDATGFILEDRGGVRATWDAWNDQRTGGSTMDMDRNAQQPEDAFTGRDAGAESESASDDRLDTEFQYVIGHVTQRDVIVDGQVVVPANTQVTAADATGALASGALEDLAFAVGMGDPSKTDVHGLPDDVEGSTEPEASNFAPEAASGADAVAGPDTAASAGNEPTTGTI